MTDNKKQIENAARNARIEKELAAALSNRNKKNESKTKGRKKKKTKVDNSIFVITDEKKLADSLTEKEASLTTKASKSSKASKASSSVKATKASKEPNNKTISKKTASATSKNRKTKEPDDAPIFRIKNIPANLKPLYVRGSEVISVSNTIPSIPSKTGKKVRGPKEPLNFHALSDVTFVDDKTVVLSTPFVVTCSICGSTKDVGYFKNANICLKCLSMIKKKM